VFQAGSNPLHWIEAEVGGRSPGEAKKRPTIEVRRYEKAPIAPIDSIYFFSKHTVLNHLGMGQNLLLPYLEESTSINQLF